MTKLQSNITKPIVKLLKLGTTLLKDKTKFQIVLTKLQFQGITLSKDKTTFQKAAIKLSIAGTTLLKVGTKFQIPATTLQIQGSIHPVLISEAVNLSGLIRPLLPVAHLACQIRPEYR